jgi:hypothetical protein
MYKVADVTQAVFIDSGNEDNSDVPIPAKVKPRSKPHSTKVPKPEFEHTPAVPEVKPKSKPPSANLNPKLEDESPVANISGAVASNINTLPAFARSTWGNTFLPTLYDRLGCASDPFVIDIDMVKVIQEVVDLAYPDSDYQVQLGDRIFVLVSPIQASSHHVFETDVSR